MKEEAWIKKQLKDIERLQKVILTQQGRVEDSIATLKKESALTIKKIQDLDQEVGRFVSPELEQAIKVVSVRAASIDKKVSDAPCGGE